MSYLFSDLEIHIEIMLIIALFFVLIYESINGCHDTANSVVTVIYTCALRSYHAVIMSGIFNFLGVILSGVSVSYAIIHLLPTYFFINTSINHIFIMIFSMLSAAILWNFGTWYIGLPTSSSHTLIGALIGIGYTNSIITNTSIIQTLNITQLINIFLSLIIFPIIGIILSKIIITLLLQNQQKYNQYQSIHITPSEHEILYGKRQPSLWTRIILIISAAGVSFSHGANDGQKGIGLIMLLLIGIAPSSFILNMNSSKHDISCTRNAINSFQEYYIQNNNYIQSISPKEIVPISISKSISKISKQLIIDSSTKPLILQFNNKNYPLYNCKKSKIESSIEMNYFFYDPSLTLIILQNASYLLKNINNYKELNLDQRFQIRQILTYITDIIDQIIIQPDISKKNKNFLKKTKTHLLKTIEYAPTWIILAVALSLSLGTIIGWKRIAITIGEKIGKKEMTYAQGLSAQLTTAISIGTASYIGMPVSTTHVLSSSIIGSMLMKGWGVHSKIIKNILITWILTLPVSILLSSSFYWISLKLLHKYI